MDLVGAVGDESAAVEVFESAYLALTADNATMVHKFIRDTIDLMVDGATPSVFAEVLADAPKTSELLVPLLAALRKLAGHPMRVPEEMSQVADDVIEEIEARRP